MATNIMGNILDDDFNSSKEDLDRVRISRANMTKSRQRVTTVAGADIGISLDRGQTLRHGDVLQGDGLGRLVVVEQIPEMVATLRLVVTDLDGGGHDKTDHRLPVLVGHIIGNRHRPISIKENGASIVFPIQDNTEIETFERLLAVAAGRVEISAGEEIFVPDAGADVHGHQ